MKNHSSKSPKSPKTAWYTLFALVVLIMCWESNLNAAALVTPTIPEEAIRIRILAHSDAPRDQWIKKQVREAMAAELSGWGIGAGTIEEARSLLAEKLPDLERVAAETLARYGFTYGVSAELGQVAFPAKTFEGTIYPAGEYEALRITLGDGRGENWWCVLFPPLCFGGGTVKAKSEETEPGTEDAETAADGADRNHKTDDDTEGKNESKTHASENANENAHEDANGDTNDNANGSANGDGQTDGAEVETRLFFVDLFKKVKDGIKQLFA